MKVPFSFELLHHSGFLQQIWESVEKHPHESPGHNLTHCSNSTLSPSGSQRLGKSLPGEADEQRGTELAGRRAAWEGTHTVCDDTAKGGSFEVKLNIHVFSLQRERPEKALALLLFPPPMGRGLCCPAHSQHTPPLLPGRCGHSQIERSCHCGWSWHCQMLWG